MRQFIVATHGTFAAGIMDSIRMLCGEQENVTELCCYTEAWETDGGGLVEQRIAALLDSYPTDTELVVVVDILGGSICNEFIKQMDRRPFHLLAGLSLPLLLELFSRDGEPVGEMIDNSLDIAQAAAKYVNPLVKEIHVDGGEL